MSGLYVPSTYESNCQAIFCLALGVEAAEDCRPRKCDIAVEDAKTTTLSILNYCGQTTSALRSQSKLRQLGSQNSDLR